MSNSNQKTILAIWNAGEKGKTDSLREFSNIFIKKYPKAKPISPDTLTVPTSGDFRLVVNIAGVILGVESQGDPSTNLEKRLVELIKKFKCDIILCSCRTRGETVAAIENISNKFQFETIWTSTYQTDDENKHKVMNKLKGKHILELLIDLGLL